MWDALYVKMQQLLVTAVECMWMLREKYNYAFLHANMIYQQQSNE